MESTDFIVRGGKRLSGEIETNTSKNGSVALLCAALINKNTTRLEGIANIEEVHRLIEVLEGIDVSVVWEDKSTVIIKPPEKLKVKNLKNTPCTEIRSGLMLIPAIAQQYKKFDFPLSGGCEMGKRTTIAHVHGLAQLGIEISKNKSCFQIEKTKVRENEIAMFEASDTATINIILTAALIPQVTTISFASANYQVQEVCFFLEKLGVQIEGVGTKTMRVHGVKEIDTSVEYVNSEDPIDSMAFITAGITTNSPITIKRIPIDFLTLEILTLESMGLSYSLTSKYLGKNGKTRLADITIRESSLVAPQDKINALPYPGINTDNLPFFVPIATQAEGVTLIHDWMWENRALYYAELNRLGAKIELLDPHRCYVHGKTKLMGSQVVSPYALRPAIIILIAMLAGSEESILRDTYIINRGYENIVDRFNSLGADITVS